MGHIMCLLGTPPHPTRATSLNTLNTGTMNLVHTPKNALPTVEPLIIAISLVALGLLLSFLRPNISDSWPWLMDMPPGSAQAAKKHIYLCSFYQVGLGQS